ncbi:MAG: hypothetical protein HY699_19325 [Deltaproteobacteria bacterium]|nr:hypothetical protein [Deltaproteobacteria bacterium]
MINVAKAYLVTSCVLWAALQAARAEMPPDDPLLQLAPEAIIREHVLPNIQTPGEAAEVKQLTMRADDQQVDRFTREAVIQPGEARVVIQYATGTRPRYTDTIRDGARRQEYRVSPDRPVRRIQTGQDFPIKGSAFSFRDLHWLLETYRWIEKTHRDGHVLLTGENGPYPKIVIELDRVLGAVVMTSMRMFESDGKLTKVQTCKDFVVQHDKVRPTWIQMATVAPDPSGSHDNVTTTLELKWLEAETAGARP